MKITSRTESDVLVLKMSGSMTIGAGDAELGEAVRTALEQQTTKILLEMSEVPLLDSMGVGTLVSAYSLTNRSGCSLKLLSLTPRVKDVIEISGLSGIFQVFDDETAAVASFS